MKNYGLAIGGPLDGQYVSHEGNMMRIPVPDGQIVTLADGRRAAYQPNLHFSYVFVTRYWYPYEHGRPIPGLTTILEALENTYHRVHTTKETA